MLTVTPIYAILLTGIFLVLSSRVIISRRTEKIAYGDNDSPRVHARIRAHANWAEYVPITLLLLMMAELQGVSAVLLHLTGLTLLIARALHGYGMSFNPKWFRGRVWGMLLTFVAMGLGLALNIIGLF